MVPAGPPGLLPAKDLQFQGSCVLWNIRVGQKQNTSFVPRRRCRVGMGGENGKNVPSTEFAITCPTG
jgi:hypothetical protein